jgi:hypothetical protein
MWSVDSRWEVASFLVLVFAGAAFSQERDAVAPAEDAAATAESPADPAKKYLELKKSRDRAIRALAERYDALIGIQEWVDVTGNHKAKGKYVAHDPELKWVKLAVATGSGDKQAVKESTVQFASLNKASQAKVRQIAALQKKLDTFADEEKTAGSAAMEGGSGPRDGESISSRHERSGTAGNRGERRTATVGEESSAGNGEAVDPGPLQPWQTNYDKFRANFKATKDKSGQWKLDYGALKALNPRLGDYSRLSPAQQKRSTDAANLLEKRLSDVTWEARFKSYGGANAGHLIEFDLTPLPSPYEVKFTADEQAGSTAEEWSRFKNGDRVRFRATIHVVDKMIAVLVREPQLVEAASADSAASGSNAEPTAESDNPLEAVIEQR